MGEHGGCGILVVLVLLVAVLFGAGYLLATENLAASVEETAAARAAAEAALAQAQAQAAEAAAAAAAAIETAEAERAAAEAALRANEVVLAQLRQENAGLAWQSQRLAEQEAETARLRQDLASANANAAEKARLLELETARRVAAELELGRIPVTNGTGGLSDGKLITAGWVMLATAGLGMALTCGAAVRWSARPAAGNPRRVVNAEHGEVSVRMTREEAREYARWKARK